MIALLQGVGECDENSFQTTIDSEGKPARPLIPRNRKQMNTKPKLKIMKNKNCNSRLATLLVTAAFSTFAALAADNLSTESQEAITAFQQKDSTIKPLFDSAAGYAVFPSVGKGGLIVGGAHGNGL